MKFFPGQRIKNVRGVLGHGVEAIYAGPASLPGEPEYDMLATLLQGTDGTVVDMGPLRLIVPAVAGETIVGISANWDPALPPGMKSIEEEGELWEPQTEEITQ